MNIKQKRIGRRNRIKMRWLKDKKEKERSGHFDEKN